MHGLKKQFANGHVRMLIIPTNAIVLRNFKIFLSCFGVKYQYISVLADLSKFSCEALEEVFLKV